MLESLLKSGRIVVIVDGYSEMTEAATKRIQPESPKFIVNKLVVTSRLDEHLQLVGQTSLAPQRLNLSVLTHFVQAYLESKERISLFTGTEVHALCGEIETMIAQEDITPLLAELYLKYAIASKEKAGAGYVAKPTNIPALVLEYLNLLNQKISNGKRDDLEVHRSAKVITWACLRGTFHPIPAKIKDVLAILSETKSPKGDLKYFEERLRLIETIQPGEEIRFALDPLAEYLAALHLVDINGSADTLWREFIKCADCASGSPHAIVGFLRAVADAYKFRNPDLSPDNFLIREIDKRIKKSKHHR